MRGYFAIGVEGLSKEGNFGNLVRTAHAFGASFFFTIAAEKSFAQPGTDTSNSSDHLPYYPWASGDAMQLPHDCRLVGVELTDDAVDLPSFRHPTKAAYILGPERGNLTRGMQDRCEFIIKIPTRFCLNVATAGAIIMYDRVQSMGGFTERPVRVGGPKEPRVHTHGSPKFRADIPQALKG
ncbi:SpoU rRNA Methylase family protein [Cohaesibacter sp. ES.047]|uniref:RNA methyltransferase n=1 Tax=Cohaesibacter sp. ES.047 TaxID=1798205 RepID=UPI000BB76B7A|nr:RNA methyltransferase [Cohaesibacter sp. ES.047]SNY90628.1 SpoU rRNA Methylase family protein [Cohaesibacter sp. ES.047]